MGEKISEKNIMIVNQHFQDINPLICGEEKCEPSHNFGPAIREYYLIHYIISGRGFFEKKGKKYKVKSGEIFIIQPFELTYYEADKNEPWHYCWIGFESQLELKDILKEEIIFIPECENIFYAIKSCNHMKNGKELYLCGKIYELLSKIREQQVQHLSQSQEYMLKVKNYIEVNYMEPITVEGMAQMLNLDRSYLSNIFKKYIEKSPQQYLVDFRLQKAAELMSLYSYKVGEAALSVGYADIYNFSKMFKRKFGVCPTEYIKRNDGTKGGI